MKRVSFFGVTVLASLLASCATPSAPTAAPQPAAWLQDIQDKSRLVAEINALRAADQFERNKIVALLQDRTMPPAEKEARVKELGEMITRNDRLRTARLKEILKTTDLMQMAQIDQGTAGSALLLIDHAGDDLPFQKSQLPSVLELVKQNIMDGQHFALLTDKIAVAENRPQVYGSQGKCENNVWTVLGPHDRAAIIAARNEIKLQPLDDYLKEGAAIYGCGG